MTDLKTTLTQNMLIAASEFGVAMVQEIAVGALKQKSDMSLRDFIILLNEQSKHMRKAIEDGIKNHS